MDDIIKKKYQDVGGILDNALSKANDIELMGNEENAELEAIKATISNINSEFKNEIQKLESSSEWDKLCIAYFGETNAGKSTIIESLRIIYNEESRWLEKEKQDRDFATIISKHHEEFVNLINALKALNLELYNPERKRKETVKRIIAILLSIIVGIVIGLIIHPVLF